MRIPGALVGALRAARHVCVLTGSGVSAESGVPTFREAQTGLWEKFDPQQLATPEAFLDDPALIWRWYRWRRELVARAQPNPGHHALVKLARLVPQLTLITQNVDGLHQRAGSRNVTEFHGNLFANRCVAENCVIPDAITDDDSSDGIPLCPGCGGMLRPGVVWFGEAIPADALQAADIAASNCDIFLSIGTSSLVWPAAGLAELAQQQGAKVIEINLDETPLTGSSHFVLNGKSGVVLPELLNCFAL
jgi:NAD-dependent deacetylase